MKPDLQVVAIDIFKLCMKNSIRMEEEWIPRSKNEKADYLSKIQDSDDWGNIILYFTDSDKLIWPFRSRLVCFFY